MTLKQQAETFLADKRIAVAGVSSTTQDAANGIYKRLRELNYEVFAVNPNASEVEGDPCYPNVMSIPGGVKSVVIVTHPDVTPSVVRDCKEAGVRRVWMHKGMGSSVSEEAVEFCRLNGIDVIAGGCPMMFAQPVDWFHGCMRTVMGWTGGLPK